MDAGPLAHWTRRRERTLPRLVARLEDAGLARQVVTARDRPRVRVSGRWVLSFAATDYLGLSQDPAVTAAAARAALRSGISLATPRILGGDAYSRRLEAALAVWTGQAAALVFASTTHLALDLLPLLAGASGVLLVDEWAYPISQAAAALAGQQGSRVRRFPHNDTAALAALLAEHWGVADKVIVVDGVYPADGRAAPLAQMAALAARWGAIIYVDDAHGIGLLGGGPGRDAPYGRGGAGTPAYCGLAGGGPGCGSIVHAGSLSKSLGAPVAFVAGPAAFVEYLAAVAGSFTHASPPALPVTAAALAAIGRHAECGDRLRAGLAVRVRRLVEGLRGLGCDASGGLFPVQSVYFPTAEAALAAGGALRSQGIWPVVQLHPQERPTGGALRFVLTARHSAADVAELLAALAALSRQSTGTNISCTRER